MLDNYLSQYHADVDYKSHSGLSPLYIASRLGHLSVVILLLSKGANVNLTSADGCGVLAAAILGGFYESVYELILRGAIINVTNPNEQSPLLLACSKIEYLPIVDLLLSNGADVHFKDILGQTPLLIVAMEDKK